MQAVWGYKMEQSEKRHSYDEILGRLDERTANLTVAVDDIKRRLNEKYVTMDEFKPIRAIVYGFVGIVLTGVVVAIVALVVKS